MDGFTGSPDVRLDTRRKSRWPLKIAVVLLGSAMVIWSIVLPVFGIVYLIQQFS